MEFCKEPYQATIEKPIILPSKSEYLWEKFVYFDKKTEENPNNYTYEETKCKLLEMWFEQFQKEYGAQVPIFKKGGKE